MSVQADRRTGRRAA